MEVFVILMSLSGIIFLIKAFVRYDPKFDLVQSGRKYILFFWYNKYTWDNVYNGRKYIKMFEI